MTKKFKHIDPPYGFRDFYSKYPHGYSIYEALLEWVQQVNDLTEFINTIPNSIETATQEQLQAWLEDGTLESIINEGILGNKLDTSVFEEYLEEEKSKVLEITEETFNLTTLQEFINLNPYTTLRFKAGNYSFTSPLLLKSNNIEGESGAIIINDLTTLYGTETGLFLYGFNAEGVPVNRKNISQVISNTQYSLTLASVTGLSVGDVVATDSYIGVIVNITDNTLTLDRKVIHTQNGKQAWGFNNFFNVSISNLEINLNNKYGFGIKTLGGKVNIKNITIYNIGSRGIEVKEAIDSNISHSRFTKAFDKTEGHGYGLRVTYSDNTTVNNVIGSDLRHTVDINKAYNSIVENCFAYNNTTSFMTHNSGALNTVFKNNSSYNASTGAYGGLDTGGDLYTTIDGGVVEGSFVEANHLFLKETVIKNVTFINTVFSPQGHLTLTNCDITQDSTPVVALFRLTLAGVTELIGCKIRLNTSRELVYSSAGVNSIRFYSCIIEIDGMNTTSTTHADNEMLLSNCSIKVTNKTNTSPTFNTYGTLIVDTCYIKGAISNIAGSEATGTLIFKNNTLVDLIKAVFARSGAKLRLGNNTLINSFYVDFTNWNVVTLGVVNTETITGGTWADGSLLIHDNSLKVRKAGAWTTL